LALGGILGNSNDWRPIVAVPLIASIVLAVIMHHKRSNFDWRKSFFPLAVFSLSTTPYLWFYDFSLMLPMQLMFVSKMNHTSHRKSYYKIITALLGAQLMFGIAHYFTISEAGYYFWVPPVMLAIYYYGMKLMKEPNLPLERFTYMPPSG
jgi:hypothetical protein